MGCPLSPRLVTVTLAQCAQRALVTNGVGSQKGDVLRFAVTMVLNSETKQRITLSILGWTMTVA